MPFSQRRSSQIGDPWARIATTKDPQCAYLKYCDHFPSIVTAGFSDLIKTKDNRSLTTVEPEQTMRSPAYHWVRGPSMKSQPGLRCVDFRHQWPVGCRDKGSNPPARGTTSRVACTGKLARGLEGMTESGPRYLAWMTSGGEPYRHAREMRLVRHGRRGPSSRVGIRPERAPGEGAGPDRSDGGRPRDRTAAGALPGGFRAAEPDARGPPLEAAR
jgi:hypothetical protein